MLDYALYPTESASNYYDLLTGLKNRGLEKVLLFTTDGSKGIKEKLLELLQLVIHYAIISNRKVGTYYGNKKCKCNSSCAA